MANEYIGCGSGNCKIKKPVGQHTNGPCTCLRSLSTADRINMEKFIYTLRQEAEYTSDKIVERLLQWRGIEKVEDVCPDCQGSGQKVYANTSTWRHGIGGQALTNGVCDTCWGSGDITNKWFDLRKVK